jgi:rubrerythrin
MSPGRGKVEAMPVKHRITNIRPRHLDQDIQDQAREASRSINALALARKDKYRSNKWAEIPGARFKTSGQGNINGIACNEMWQKRALDELGEIHRTDGFYTCPCGQIFAQGFPPEVCPYCHRLGPIARMRTNR